MNDTDQALVFHPVGKPAMLEFFRQAVLIALGFFVFAQLFFLEGWQMRLFFSLLFVGFLLIGGILSWRSFKTWPQTIWMDEQGIGYSAMARRDGMERLPWRAIKRMDLFYNDVNMAPFLRIALHPGLRRDALPNDHGARRPPQKMKVALPLIAPSPQPPPGGRGSKRALREFHSKSSLKRLSRGWDINIPLAVQADPDQVLAAAQGLWQRAQV
jgi:hypothetical protein